jgi:hypothetical protein
MSDRYYEPDSEDDDYPDWFPIRVAELMMDEYSIAKYDNFAEGITEAAEADRAIISEMLNKPHIDIDFAALGRKVWSMAYDYMERFAENSAQEDWDRGNRD